MSDDFDLNDIKRRMDGAVNSLKNDLSGLRTGRASASLVEPITVEAYGAAMPMNQVATISVPEPRLLSVQVWDRRHWSAPSRRRCRESDLGLNPSRRRKGRSSACAISRDERAASQGDGQGRQQVRGGGCASPSATVRDRDGLDTLKELEKDGLISQDDEKRQADLVQKATDGTSPRSTACCRPTEKEIMQVPEGRMIARRAPPRGVLGAPEHEGSDGPHSDSGLEAERT